MCDYCKDEDFGNGFDRTERLLLRLDRLMNDWRKYRMQKWEVRSVIEAIESVLQCEDLAEEIRERYAAAMKEAREV